MTHSDPRASGASMADAAPGKGPDMRDHDPNAPHARRRPDDSAGEKPDQLEGKDAENRQEALLDEGIEETFPASDPVSAKRIT